MENPCKKCLLVNSCTAVCEDKTNLQTLLNRIMRQHGLGGWVHHISHPNKLYLFWMNLKKENDLDVAVIVGRAERLKNGIVSW